MWYENIWWLDSSVRHLGNAEYPFIDNDPRSTQTWSGRALCGQIQLFDILNVLYESEFLEIELFDHLTECKQMTNFLIEFLVIHCYTYDHLTVCKQMSNVKQNKSN